MQKKCNRKTLFFIWLVLLSALNCHLNAQICCCDAILEIDVPGGDFELPPPPAPGGWIDYTAGQFLGPWEIVSGSVSHHDDGHNNLGAGNPNPSTAHLDINGFSIGAVCQDISGFIVGQEYELVFYYAIHNAIAIGMATVEIDGGAALSETWSATNVGSNLWLEATYNFIATSETMSLCFYSNTNVNCCGMLIDDIQIFINCIQDVEIPEIITMPSDATYQCIQDVPEPMDIVTMDDCDNDLTIIYTETYSSNDFCEVVISRTWTVEDDCQNMTSYTQNIFVADLQPPQIAQPLIDLTVNCDADAEGIFFSWVGNFGGGIIYDNCSDFYSLADYQIPDFNTCSETEVIFTFGDFCGNETNATAYFEIIDNEVPLFDSLPQNLIVPCGDDGQILIDDWLSQNGYAQVSDNCTYSLDNTFNGNYNESQSVTFTATDLCGNQAWFPAEITIITDVEIIQIDTFTCNPEQEGIVEIQIDNEFCDSLIQLNFILLPSDTVTIEKNTCDVLEAGLDTIYLTNSSNCDSLVITNNIFSPGDTLYTNTTTCDVLQAGLDTLFLMNANNCDSLVITNTIFTAGDTLFNEVTSCDVAQVGMDTLFLSNANNCDSLVITNTIFSSGDTLFNEVTTCDVAQVGMDTLFLSNANNCDSLVITNTVFSAGDTLFNAVPTCDESEVSLDTQYLLNSNNCDSLVITSTFLVQNDTILITDYSCDIEQAEYSNIIIPGPVCDTVVLMELLPLESDMIVLEYTTCKIAEEGVISENYTNQSGCDSIVISNFVYVPLDTFYVATETCFIEELQQDTVVVLGDDCDSIFVYSTILLEGNQTTIETFICDPENAQMDTNYYQNQNGCDSLVITSYEFNPIAFEWVQTYDPCDDSQERSIQIINPQGNTQPFIFSINGNDFYDLTEFSMLDSGTYLIYAQDTNGCISEPVEVIFDFHAPLVTNLPSNLTINLETSQQIFLEFSAEPDTFYWDDENLVSCTSCLDPFILADQDVALTLFYTNDYGCLFSDTIDIKVEEELNDFFIPNVFSPNGDNANDLFHLFTNDPSATLELCEIYDRWGNKFYQNYDPNLKELKWDGKFNGSEAATGVYLYRIVLLNSKGDRIYLIGDVTLVR